MNMLSDCNSRVYVDKNNFLCNDVAMLRIRDLFDIGDIVRALRLKRGIKGEKEIKRILATDKDTISRIERTSKFEIPVMERIATRLGTSLAELYAARDALHAIDLATSAMQASQTSICNDHYDLMVMLDDIIHKNARMGEWIAGNIVTFHAALANPPASTATEVNQVPPPIRGAVKRTRTD